MAKLESLQKKIDKIDRDVKYIQNIILVVMSSIIWSVYAILEDKADEKILILSIPGAIVFIFLITLWIIKDVEQEKLIQKLEEL